MMKVGFPPNDCTITIIKVPFHSDTFVAKFMLKSNNNVVNKCFQPSVISSKVKEKMETEIFQVLFYM